MTQGAKAERTVSVAPGDYAKAEWSLKTWKILDGLKVDGTGDGFFEYAFDVPAEDKPAVFRASLERLGAWMRSCAKGLEVGRDPLWQFLTPYFERFAKERDARALHDEMIALAPLLRREEKWTPEESDFAPTLEKWCGLFAPEHRQLAKDVEDALTKAVVR